MADRMDIKQALNTIDSLIKDPSNGLPEDVFLFASRITPMVNVDLLIMNEWNQTLLTWRDDGFGKAGWHMPSGIIRYKETMAERILATAKSEFGAEVEFLSTPMAINEIICPERKNRAHFISLLYQCSLLTSPDERLQYKSGAPLPGQWAWHETCPEN